MSLLDALMHSGSVNIELINLDDILRRKEDWEVLGERTVRAMEVARRAVGILQTIDRDDQAEALEIWTKAQLEPIVELIRGHSIEEYDTDEKREQFVTQFKERATALLPVVESIVDEIKTRHRKAMADVDLSDLFPIPAPTENNDALAQEENSDAD